MALISQSEWARRQGFSKQYAAKLIKQGKIHLIDGMIDEYTANAELEMRRNINLPRQRKSQGSYFVRADLLQKTFTVFPSVAQGFVALRYYFLERKSATFKRHNGRTFTIFKLRKDSYVCAPCKRVSLFFFLIDFFERRLPYV